VFEHVGFQQLHRFLFRGLQRLKRISPVHLADVGVSAGLLEAANPHLAAGMVGWAVAVGDGFGDGAPEVVEGAEELAGHGEKW
jgi:hypothetical protein